MKYQHRRWLTAVPLFLLRTIVVGVETTAERVVNWADLKWHRLRWWEEAPIRAALEVRRGPFARDVVPAAPGSISGEIRDYSRTLAEDEGWPSDAELYPAESCEDHGVLDCKTCDPDCELNAP